MKPGGRTVRRVRRVAARAAFPVLLAALASSVEADLTLESRLSAGVSDNINFVPEGGNELDETIHLVSTRFGFNHETARTSTNVGGNVQYYRYLHDTFDDELIGGTILNFEGRIVPRRVRWSVVDHYGQQYLDPFDVITPGTRRDVHIFRTGPGFTLPVGSRSQVEIELRRSLTSVEDTNIDNARDDVQVTFNRAHNTRWRSAIGVSSRSVEYDDVEGFDFDVNSVFVRVGALGNASNLVMTLGTNEVDNQFGDSDGTRFDVRYERELAAGGTLAFRVGRGFSDAGNLFRYSQANFIDVGQTQDIVATPDPFENTNMFVTYRKQTRSGAWSIQAFTREDAYETQSQFDRDEVGIRFILRRTLAQYWEFGADGYSVRRDLQRADQPDDTHIWSVEFSRRLGQKLSAGVRAELRLRDEAGFDLQRRENRYYLFLNYLRPGTGRIGGPTLDDLDTF